MKSIVDAFKTTPLRWQTPWLSGGARARQTGMTLVELIIAIAIISLMAGGIAMAVHQLLTSNRQANDQQYAVSQLRQAEHWITQDAQMTWTINSSGFPLTLSWTGIVDQADHQVTYTLEGPSGSLKRLQRYELVDGIPNTLVVAQNIDDVASSCSFTAPMLSVTLVVTSGGHTETRVFEVKPRKTLVTVDGT